VSPLLAKKSVWEEVLTWTLISGDYGHYGYDTEIGKNKVTHWMPLPDVPPTEPDMWFIVALYTDGTVKKILETPFDSSSEAKEVGRTIMKSMPVMLEPLFYRWTVLTEEEYLEYEKNGIDLTKRNK
jgi:hypothetical protein